jgi:hypothetical protein
MDTGIGGGEQNRIRLFGSHYTLERWINGYGVKALLGRVKNFCCEFEFEYACRKCR